jgi:hypothetical protein
MAYIERLRNPWPRLREKDRKRIAAVADAAIAADRRKVPRRHRLRLVKS